MYVIIITLPTVTIHGRIGIPTRQEQNGQYEQLKILKLLKLCDIYICINFVSMT